MFNTLDSKTTNIDFQNTIKNSTELNILNYLYFYNGSGVAVADFNNDNLLDLYFTSNQSSDEIYLNQGDMRFKKTTSASGINNSSGWTTGVSIIDINHDGLMDIYICKVGDYNSISGHNLLYVNQGLNDNNVPFFNELSSQYGLDFKSFATQSTFFDYDLDGDLDLFLLNHSVHPNGNYGKGSLRTKVDALSGDRLYKNNNGNFVDITKESKIFQGRIGYGLGISTSDLNNDGYPDLYISNDFFENDYLYLNQRDGTFKDVVSNNKNRLGHTSHFSMGNDIADINNDGHTDIVSLDMLTENIETYKASGTEYPYQNYKRYLMNGYAPQYMQNTLQLNNGNGNFSEIAFASGIAATEWSWSSLFADFDNDGYKDLFITNGIVGATNDMDFIRFIANDNIQKRISMGMTKEDLSLIDELPEKKVKNYIFKNNKDLTFTNTTKQWLNSTPSFSNGSIYADLDNDGDLDLVTNNINETAHIYENSSNTLKTPNNYIKINFKGSNKNTFGIGAKIKIFSDSLYISQENYTTRGYLSSVAPNLNIGLNQTKVIDSLMVIWPKGNYETLKNVPANSTIILNELNSNGHYYKEQNLKTNAGYLKNSRLNINYKHQDNSFVEFTRDPLIPYMNTYQGPDLSITDVNNDGLEDLFLSGAKTKPSQLFIQQIDGTFLISNESVFITDKLNEDTKHIFLDVDLDNDKDLIVVSGGNEFKKGKPLQPRLYINDSGNFIKKETAFDNIELNASIIIAEDIDNDGDQDLFIGSNAVPHAFGKTPVNYIFKNDGKGHFSSNILNNLGLVQDAVFKDVNNDSKKDLIVAGYWMPIKILINNGSDFIDSQNQSLTSTNGLWNCLKVEDFDNDGDLDILAGNWGLNTRLKASVKKPITLYLNDFDNNKTVDPVMTYYHQNKETCFSTKEELTKQMPFLNKKFLSYTAFAKADLKDLFSSKALNASKKKYIYTLETTYLENQGDNSFLSKKLPFLTQISSVHCMHIEDIDNNGFKDVILAGNRYDLNTQLGQLDASHGQLLLNFNGEFKLEKSNNFSIQGPARAINKINVKDKEYYIIGINNDSLQILKKVNK